MFVGDEAHEGLLLVSAVLEYTALFRAEQGDAIGD